MQAEDILQRLDTQFEIVRHDPPHLYQLSTHFYPADARLTAFRSADRWALVFEILGYWCATQAVRLDSYVYGGGPDGANARHESVPLQLLDTHTGTPLDGSGALDPRRFSVLWNDQRYDFAPTSRDYADAAIAFDTARPDADAHAAAQAVRYLCERLGHPFFHTDEALRGLLVRHGLGAEAVTPFLQTRAWHHPDLSQEELPSQVRSFQILARALETGDISEWAGQDPASFNTDWRGYEWAEKAAEEQQREWAARQDEAWDSVSMETRERLAREAASDTEALTVLPRGPGGQDAGAD